MKECELIKGGETFGLLAVNVFSLYCYFKRNLDFTNKFNNMTS